MQSTLPEPSAVGLEDTVGCNPVLWTWAVRYLEQVWANRKTPAGQMIWRVLSELAVELLGKDPSVREQCGY